MLRPLATTPVTGVTITPPNGLRAGVPAYFTVTVTGMPVNLMVAWGDENVVDVGAVTSAVLAHVYMSAGYHTLTVTAKGPGGSVMAGSVSVLVK